MTGAFISIINKTNPQNGFSPIIKTGSLSTLQRLALVLKKSGIEILVVVCESGNYQNKVEQQLGKIGVNFLCYPASTSSGFVGGYKKAITFLQRYCEEILFIQSNMPLFSVSTIKSLLDSKILPAVPIYKSMLCWPLLVHPSMLAPIDSIHSLDSFNELLADISTHAKPIEVDDKGILLSLDQESNWENILSDYQIDFFRPVTKLTIAKEDVFFGPGVYQLLCALRTNISIRDSCDVMEISYSKARRMIRNLEHQLGFEVVCSSKGGMMGGHSYLTSEGERILIRYENYLKECNTAIENIFERYYSDGFK